MMKKFLIFILSMFVAHLFHGQPGGGPGKPGGKGNGPTTGKIYGKIQEEENKKPIEYAVLQVFKAKANPADSTYGELITGGLSEANGDFSIDNVPVRENLVLVVRFVGFGMKEVPFTLQPSGPGIPEKDMGNIRLPVSATLKEVVIDGSEDMKIEFDKRVYDVEKNPMNAGGTGEDVLRNIPSLQVDLDGNVSMRNSAPQIFVDGRPTTLTIDQIPADAIQRVEVITNPSAKYDASGGAGGIVNIVMKHNRGMGYSGSLRLGADSRPRYNAGGDINLREGKFNFFVNGNYNQRKSVSSGTTDRISYTTVPSTVLDQTQTSVNLGYFLNGKVGIDWFVDNRNTLTVSQSLTKGKFNPTDEIDARTDTLVEGATMLPFSTYTRESITDREFQNYGSSILYKHLFAKEGTEITADINMNRIQSDFIGDYVNRYSDAFSSVLRQSGGGKMQLYTAQTDFTSKVNESLKLEFGLRGAIRHYESVYDNFRLVDSTNTYVSIPGLLVNYEYWDQVYAAYGTVSKNLEKWKIQAGLRLESSDYLGRLRDTTVQFKIQYPLSAFPSLFVTRVIDEKQDVQLALSRKINRPSFMQLIPFVDYSDSLNVSRGNPELRPEFTNLAELSYQNSYNKKNVFIATAYARFITDLTIRNQITEFNDVMQQEIVINTYDNARSSAAFGLELVSRTNVTDWFNLTVNLNLYNSSIDGTNISENLTNSLSSWWTKTNAIFKLPYSFTFQALFDYSSRKALTVGSSERGGMGGGGMGGGGGGGGGNWGGTENTVQGYVKPTYSLDLSIKKEFLKNKNMSLTISMQDVLRTRVQYTHSETDLFIQDTFRRRDWQVLRVQFGWKFGKVDSSVFKRKNMKQDGGSMEG
jgi:outer membrane receptor protein involved in Fe transport